MTIRVERTFELPAAPDRVWEFIADPERRAACISVVERYENEGDRTTWHVRLPIPILNRTVAVDTRDEEVRSPEYVRFVGKSKAMRVVGEHELEETADGTRVTNRFVVEGKVPGVERFFRRNLDGEMDNLRDAIREYLGVTP